MKFKDADKNVKNVIYFFENLIIIVSSNKLFYVSSNVDSNNLDKDEYLFTSFDNFEKSEFIKI